jgi:hypothetical protein
MESIKPNMAASIRRIRSVLMTDWDPIGVRDIPEAADEYDSYALPIYSILREQPSEDILLDYLAQLTEHIGLPASRDSLRPIAARLLDIDLSHDERPN